MTRFVADAMNETLARTSLGDLVPGSDVESRAPAAGHRWSRRPYRAGARRRPRAILDATDDGFARRIRIGAGPEVLRYVVEKGSIAVDGVSLTVAEVDERSFTVSLDPRDAAAHESRGRSIRAGE